MLIPAVFTSVFVMIPEQRRVLATTLAGICALLAPTVGPLAGGWLTQNLSWHWIFLINLAPGIVVTLTVAGAVRVGRPDPRLLRHLDILTLLLFALCLGSLEWLLHEGPVRHWQGVMIAALAMTCLAAGIGGIHRALHAANPFVHLSRFAQPGFAWACGLSFIFGMGLYGSTYALSLYLGLVHGYAPLVIGKLLLVTGIAQLLAAPLAAWSETRLDGRLLTAFGFAVFGLGLFLSGFATAHDADAASFWPQALRGVAMMFCLLPATRLALDGWSQAQVAEASGLFNLMRNLGGAIGIALIDTMVAQRSAAHAAALVTRLQAGDAGAAVLVGLPTALFRGHAMGPVDDFTRAMTAPLVQRAALAQSLNEAWVALAGLFALAVLILPAIRFRR